MPKLSANRLYNVARPTNGAQLDCAAILGSRIEPLVESGFLLRLTPDDRMPEALERAGYVRVRTGAVETAVWRDLSDPALAATVVP